MMAVAAPPPGTEERPIHYRELARAEEDLEWWYARMPGDLALSATDYEFHGNPCHDEEAARALHERRVSWRVSRARRDHDRVLPRVTSLPMDQRVMALAIYGPRRYPDHLRILFVVERPLLKEIGTLTLVGAALLCPALEAAHAKAHDGKPPHSRATLLGWLSEAVRPRVVNGRSVNQVPPAWCRETLREAREARDRLLEAYARVVRSERERLAAECS